VCWVRDTLISQYGGSGGSVSGLVELGWSVSGSVEWVGQSVWWFGWGQWVGQSSGSVRGWVQRYSEFTSDLTSDLTSALTSAFTCSLSEACQNPENENDHLTPLVEKRHPSNLIGLEGLFS
jgi:hypothetical protein